MDKKSIALIIIGILSVLIITLKVGGAYFDSFKLSILILSLAVPIVFGILSLRKIGWSDVGKSIFFISVYLLLDLVAELLWVYFDGAVVSFADVFYLIAYLSLWTGIIFLFKSDSRSDKKIIFAAFLLAAVLCAIYILVFASGPESTSLIEKALTSGYVVLDFISLALVFVLLTRIISGNVHMYFGYIAMAVMLYWIGDITYAIAYEAFILGEMLDLTWIFGHLLLGLALVSMGENGKIAIKMDKKVIKKDKKVIKKKSAA